MLEQTPKTGGTILAVPTGGGPAKDTCAGGFMGVGALAVDDTTIFSFLIYEAVGALKRVPR